VEAAVLEVRAQHPWGGRKIRRRLEVLGQEQLPAASTIHAILKRHGLLDPTQSSKHRAFQRFERPAPNALWQMDFKGHFALGAVRCHPLTVLDDHSRYSICLRACLDETTATVQQALTESFRRYGLPDDMLMDNGSPWGNAGEQVLTPLTVWLIRLEIRVLHGRPYHPQTQGKDERFHRTLAVEVLNHQRFHDLLDCQRKFDRFRDVYNLERPHEALGLEVPVTRYQPSARAFPEQIPDIEYAPGDIVRKTQDHGALYFCGRVFRISKALRGYPVALRPTTTDGQFDVFFCHHKVAQIDFRHPYE
jgi:transposase InsO family protein